MASPAAISVVATTLRLLLANSRPPGQFRDAEFQIFRTVDFQNASTRISNGLSLYLYRVGFNTNRRNQPPRVAADGRHFRPSTPVDLHFLITAWAQSAEEQMDLLGWAIQTLQDSSEFSAGLLNRFAGDRPEPVFAESESLEMVGEVLSQQEFVNIWGNALPIQQPSVSYVVRMLLIDSRVPLPSAELVQTREFEYRKLLPNERLALNGSVK